MGDTGCRSRFSAAASQLGGAGTHRRRWGAALAGWGGGLLRQPATVYFWGPRGLVPVPRPGFPFDPRETRRLARPCILTAARPSWLSPAGRPGCHEQRRGPAAQRPQCHRQRRGPAPQRPGCHGQRQGPAPQRPQCHGQRRGPAAQRPGCHGQRRGPDAQCPGCHGQRRGPAAQRPGRP